MKNPIALLVLFASTAFAIDSNSYNYFNFFNSFNSRLESTYPPEQRLIQTYSPKGYTSVTVGVASTACNKANYEHPKLCYIVATTGHKSKQGSRLAQLKIKKVSPAADAKQ